MDTKTKGLDSSTLANYIYTYSGQKVELAGTGVPTVEDIAVQLGRTARFAGATSTYWTVLHHSLAAELVARRWSSAGGRRNDEAYVRLYALMHDAHESLTGDVPAPFKSARMKIVQEGFDERIYKSLGVPSISENPEWQEVVHGIDMALLGVEGEMLGPPSEEAWWEPCENRWTRLAEDVVTFIQFKYRNPEDTVSPQGKAVKIFQTLVHELIKEVEEKENG